MLCRKGYCKQDESCPIEEVVDIGEYFSETK